MLLPKHPPSRWQPQLIADRLWRRSSQTTSIELSSEGSSSNVDIENITRRQRQIYRKRRQGGETFLDYTEVTVQGGKGGDGCVAFNREKFKPFGPPSGGNGGRGSDIYVMVAPHLTTLSSLSKNTKGAAGGNGQGTWMNGRHAPPTVIYVPKGTVVKELTGFDAEKVVKPWDREVKEYESLSTEEKLSRMRQKRWLHYPGAEDDNVERDSFREAERILALRDSERRWEEFQSKDPIFLDLDEPNASHLSSELPTYKPVTAREVAKSGYLLASGGVGGVGNAAFVTSNNRSPKFATRGTDGQRRVFSFELKILADVGLVGFPNAGKSTLLRALTGGRSKTEVAEYAFTTLNPVVGVVRLNDDDMILTDDHFPRVIENSSVERETYNSMMKQGAFAYSPSSYSLGVSNDYTLERREAFRFTIADNPGLISHASENVGLGHSFLRSIERSSALVYVVDFSLPSPQEQLLILRDELEKYKPGLSRKARMVLANKADLLAQDGSEIQEAKEKLENLKRFVQTEMRAVFSIDEARDGETLDVFDKSAVIEVGKELDVIPISAKFSQNLKLVARLLRSYVEESKRNSFNEMP